MPYDEDLPQDAEGASSFLRRLVSAIDQAVSISLTYAPRPEGEGGKTFERSASIRGVGPINPSGAELSRRGGRDGQGIPVHCSTEAPQSEQVPERDQSSSAEIRRPTAIFNAVFVRARQFYGYSKGERLFIKLSLVDPSLVQR